MAEAKPDVYAILSKKFSRIEKALPSDECRVELDGLLSDLAKEMLELPKFFERGVLALKKQQELALELQRDSYARAICHLCSEGVPRSTENGREVHHDGSVIVRCAANALFSTNANLVPAVFTKHLPKENK